MGQRGALPLPPFTPLPLPPFPYLPFSSLQSYSLPFALSPPPPVQRDADGQLLVKEGGFLEYIIDRRTESSHGGKVAKFEIVQVGCPSPLPSFPPPPIFPLLLPSFSPLH